MVMDMLRRRRFRRAGALGPAPAEEPRESAGRDAPSDRLRLGLIGGALAIVPFAVIFGPLHEDDRFALGIGVAVIWLLMLITGNGALGRADRLRRVLAAERDRLAQSEERLRLIFENSALAISITDNERRTIEVSPSTLRILGYTEEEFRELGISGVTYPDDVDLDAGLFAELVAGIRESFRSMKRYVAKDGRIVWGRGTYTVARNPDGSVRFAIGMVEDVTLQRLAEEELDAAFDALQASEDRFRGAFEAGGFGMMITALDGTVIRANRALCAITGYTEDELRGRDVIDITHPDDVALSVARFESTAAAQGAQSFEKRYVCKDGSVVWVRLTTAPVRDSDGEPLYHIAHVEDLTVRRELEEAGERAAEELRRSEERSWTLLSKTLELMCVLAPDATFTWVNPATERLFGHDADELIGMNAIDFVHEDDRAAVLDALEQMIVGGANESAMLTYRIRDREGRVSWLEGRGINLVDDPLVRGVLVSARDVTERAAMEEARARLEFERRVAQRLEAVGQLAAGIAHEINTPIQFVGDSVRFLEESYEDLGGLRKRYRELLLERGGAEEAAEAEDDADLEYLAERVPLAFARIVDGVERVTSIVHAMQRFAHAPQAERAPADIDEALQATVTVSRNEYKYVADLELDLGGLPPVLCNIGDVNQVFLNLIVNAAHAVADKIASGGDRGSILVRSRVDESVDEIVVTIADNGCGIDPAVQERIFEPFFTTKDVGRGTGQGLAISRTILEQHGGAISFTSVPGEGTTFEIRLPVHPAVAEAA